MPCCGNNILFLASVLGEDSPSHKLVAVYAGSPLPVSRSVTLGQTTPSVSVTERNLLVSYALPQSEERTICRLDFTLPSPDKEYEARICISVAGEVEVSILQESRVLEKLTWTERS
jgi:hypothetical protein